jgi:hypothetical protein
MEQLTLTTPEPITIERISYLINKKGIDLTIAKIDLEMVKMKLKDVEEGLGWSDEQCETAEIEYKRFLHLNKKFPDSTIVPHTIIDLIWHQHILDTRAYHNDSNTVFGQYLHHFPYFGIRSESDRQDLMSAFEETQNIYKKEFGEKMINQESSHCKRSCVSYCTRKCNTKQ